MESPQEEDRESRIEDGRSRTVYLLSSILDHLYSTILALLRSVIPMLPGAFDQRRQVFIQQVAAFDQLQSRFRHKAQIVERLVYRSSRDSRGSPERSRSAFVF